MEDFPRVFHSLVDWGGQPPRRPWALHCLASTGIVFESLFGTEKKEDSHEAGWYKIVDRSNSQSGESLETRLEVPPVDGPEEDVDGVEEVLPDVGRGQVDPLLHVATRLEPRLAELRHLRKDTARFGIR